MKKLVLKNLEYVDYIKNRRNLTVDYLTGLYNRRAMYEYYSELSKDKMIHVMYIDVDNFKRVNDVYGHSEGDKLLQQAAFILQQKIPGKRIYRIGGDEFVAILDAKEFTQEKIISIVDSIQRGLPNMDFRKDILSFLSLSIGLLFDQDTTQMLDEILNKCDSAMYQAKANGKNRYVVYEQLEKMYETNKSIESEMEKALENGEFVLYFQPKINMLNSKMQGAEVLTRWMHPTDGLRFPMQFIPLFEKNGFITKLDMYIYEEICKIKRSWKGTDLEHLKVSFNLSRIHLYFKNLPDKLLAIAENYGINPAELEIEITESTFFKDSLELIKVVERFKRFGFLVSIDDFGSGFSALNMLKDIPVNTVKFDKEFLQMSSNNYKGRKVIKNIIIMCKDLKLNVLAEGVEKQSQAEFLTACGCEIAQGFLYSRPLPLEEFEEYAYKHINLEVKPIYFSLNNTLASDDGKYVGEYIPETAEDVLTYAEGPADGLGSVYLPGSSGEYNLVRFPKQIVTSESYTMMLWAKTEEERLWTALLYVKFETGFAGIIPNAWEGHATYRIRDSKTLDGWYDTFCLHCPVGEWMHVAITYNAETESTAFYINGDVMATRTEVPTQRFTMLVELGGDVFQQSYKGWCSELYFCSDVKSPSEIKEIYIKYEQMPGFKGLNKDFI